MPRDGKLPRECLLWCAKKRSLPASILPEPSVHAVLTCGIGAASTWPIREPYPDFYATIALMLTAQRWVHLRRKRVVVGISPKSFGRTLLGGGTDAGRAYLGIDTQFDGYLPGTDMVNGCHLTLQQLKRDFPRELKNVEISRSDYVYRQLYSWYLLGDSGRSTVGDDPSSAHAVNQRLGRLRR